ncbi:MAG: ABC transporter substrate-binding protein [Actinomycetota bacterium]
MKRSGTAVLILVLMLASCSSPKPSTKAGEGRSVSGPEESSSVRATPFSGASTSPGSATTTTAGRRAATVGSANSPAPAPVSEKSKTLGVTDREITVVYYWKGDRTRTSPYLKGTGAEANVDEAEAFRTWVSYVNKHADGGATFMGSPFNLHGRKIKGIVLEAGSTPEDQTAAAQRIATELKPFAAIAAHGSVSTYVCPFLASKGIYNIATYDLGFDLYKKTNGWCTPAYASFNAQVDAMERYLSQRVSKTKYGGTDARKFGLLYAEYPGLAAAMKTVAARFKNARINIVSQASISADLAAAQPQAANVVAKFRAAGVNTIFMPDAGSPMSFTPAAEAQAYRPDYIIWPCSGQDQLAPVRMFSAGQWARASGLTCYDDRFMVDMTMDTEARSTEWYRQYMTASDSEPPAQAPLIYSAMLPLLVGVTNAGRDLTSASFRSGMAAFSSYRYNAEKGKTAGATSMLLNLDHPEHALMGDFTELKWSTTARRSGSTFTGAYVFPEGGRRYRRTDSYR